MKIRRNIIRFLLVLVVFCGLVFVPLTSIAGAASTDVYEEICSDPKVSSESPVCQGRTDDNPLLGDDGFIAKLIRILALITAVAAVVTILISGLMFVTAQGDTSSINTAKTTLLYAIVGLVVAALAQVIVVFVVEKL